MQSGFSARDKDWIMDKTRKKNLPQNLIIISILYRGDFNGESKVREQYISLNVECNQDNLP